MRTRPKRWHEPAASMQSKPQKPPALSRGRLPLSALPRMLGAWLESKPALAAFVLYLIAAALRAVHWLTFRDTLLARVFLMDEAYYHAEALSLVRGVPNPTDSYFMTPVYPLFLSLVYRVAGESASAVYAVQLLLGAFAAPCVFLLARRAMPATWAAAAGLAVASFAPMVFHEALLLVEWMILLALLGATLLAVRAPASRAHALASGACLGIAVLGRGSNMLLAPVFAAWFFFQCRGRSRVLAQVALLVLGCMGMLSPLLVYNARHAEQPLLLTANAGLNLYLGNGPEATGLFLVPEKLDIAEDPHALRYVQRETGMRATASVAARFWMQKTLQWMRSHPRRALELLVWKWVLFWNRFSFPQVESFETASRGLPLGRLPFWHGHVALPLAFLGALLAFLGLGRERRSQQAMDPGPAPVHVAGFVAACTLTYAASIALFFITDRYRMPVMPWALLLSTYGVWRFVAVLRGEHRPRALGIAAVAALLFVLTDAERLNLDRPRMERDLRVHEALRYAKADLFDAAVGEYREALRSAPQDPDLRDGFARMLARAGQDTLALVVYHDLLLEKPDFARAWYNLGNILRRTRRHAEAVVAYERSVALEPWRESAWNNLGECYRVLGDTLAAARAYRQAVALVPGHEQALNNLGALRATQGDATAAEAGFRAAIAANPRYLPAWRNLAILLTNQQRRVEARDSWRAILALDPGDTLASRVLNEIESQRQD